MENVSDEVKEVAENILEYISRLPKNKNPCSRFELLGKIINEEEFKHISNKNCVYAVNYLFDKRVL